MGLIRRSALDEVGGWDERIITEDAEISLRVLARGYRSVYVPTPYGRGIMPLTYEGLRKQRFRWAFGGIQILRRHWRTIIGRRSGLSFAQRYDHLMGGLWWFNDALAFGFTIFVAAAALGAVTGRPFIVQRLTGIGIVLPVVFIVINLVRYVWALGTATGARPPLALAALRVNLSLSWVIALACLRALTQERGVFLRTPKFEGAPAIRELRLVWVEATVGVVVGALLVAVVLSAGYSPAGLVLAALLGWSLLIYGSAVSYALGDPARAPLADTLREKARLEIAPRVGRVARSKPARASVLLAGLASGLLAVALAAERDKTPVATLPFQNPIAGPGTGFGSAPTRSDGASPTASPSGSGRPTRSTTPGGTSPAGTTTPLVTPPSNRTPAPATARPTPTRIPPAPTPTPTLRPTPPVSVPTPAPTARPSPRPQPSAARTPPPHP
jgi:hypothetical protein